MLIRSNASARKGLGLLLLCVLATVAKAGAITAVPLCCLPAVHAADASQWEVFETSYESAKAYSNAFTEVEVDVVFQQGDKQWKVPAFWAGEKKWTVRFAPPVQGEYTYHVECTDKANTGLNGKEQTLSVAAYKGDNLLLRHGFLRVSADRRHFEHADGTPFFWLGDTWWKNLCKRMTWEGFQELTADRKAKGFSVVQIVCGPYPDENFFAPSLKNEGGQPYLAEDMSVVNPKYFDYADRRLKHLADSGIVPAIVGAWGRGDCNSMDKFGAEKIKRHWRYLIARYGAYPVIWILAGEIPEEAKAGKGPWAEVATYLRSIDPYHHPLTCHTGGYPRKLAKDDIPVIDFDMVGGSHDEHTAVAPQTVAIVSSAYSTKPPMPVLVGETCYEGHMQQGFGDVQRRIFWQSILSGAAGHTYGAAGIWHAGVEGDHGNWGMWGRQPYDYTTWKEGMNYPGAAQLGIGKKLLEQYPWQKFEPHPEWAPGCYAAGIPDGMRIIYRPRKAIYDWSGFTVNNLIAGLPYATFFFDPATGRRFAKGIVTPTSTSWKIPNVPSPQDWVLVMEPPDLGAPVTLSAAKAGQAYAGRLAPEGVTFTNQTGPGWLTIEPDGRVSGTPGEDDAGANVWLVSVTKAGGQPALMQLQIAVTGLPGVSFSEKFNRYSGDQNTAQVQSGLKVAHSGSVASWTHAGQGAMHAVDRANQAGQANPSDWSIMIFDDNVIISKAFAGNVAGQSYRVNFDASAAVYNGSPQATQAGDALLIEMLRADNSVLASTTHAPGAWNGKMTFTTASLDYKGDGSGDLRLRIGPAGGGKSGRFHGAIDTIIVK
ncbi:MAG: DUF4038 domain-containing protein [Planctomycetes bacterium]|nr:DUF4038 domain-containing protein [Planctomycetota bacterium]